jgi:uncharacterized protein
LLVQPSVAPRRSNHQLAVLCHILSFAGYVVPFGHILGPLIMWLMKREEPAVDAHGKESVNFQIAITIYTFSAVVLWIALTVFLGPVGLVFGILAFVGLALFDIISVVRGAIAASRNEPFRYPLSIRLIR